MHILKTENLSKKYGDTYALHSVNMSIKRGEIYGFIGRNGAGKTTLIKLITGLALPTDGKISIFGKSDESGLLDARKRMGAIIEYPALYLNMTAQQNLEHHRRLHNIPNRLRISETLDLVGLSDTGNKKSKDFSLGMKQRLGLAMALLNNPDFIVLDEPVNGLDPNGIIEMRETLKFLSQERGITILISSHLLTELAQIATRFGIIEKGRLLREHTAEDLKNICNKYLSVVVDDSKKACELLRSQLRIHKIEAPNKNELRIYDFALKADIINECLVENGVRVSKLILQSQDLESYFIDLTGGTNHA